MDKTKKPRGRRAKFGVRIYLMEGTDTACVTQTIKSGKSHSARVIIDQNASDDRWVNLRDDRDLASAVQDGLAGKF